MEVTDQIEEAVPRTARQKAAAALIARREARQIFHRWVEFLGFKPAKHHELLIDKIQEVTDSPVSRFVIFLLPPGSAKSTYTSDCFPPWFLGRKPGASILACSYKYDLAEKWGKAGRNRVHENSAVLGYSLKPDSKSAGEWETTTGGRYFCAGVGAGIAGHRADLGLIDDPLGSQEDADSKLMRDKQWDWFLGDFFPRLKPHASIFIIANRRHEDDLIGRLLSNDTKGSPVPVDKWEVIKLPFFPEENDPLGRPQATDLQSKIDNRLWPTWFTEDMARSIMNMPPRILAGLYQQRPAPEDGDYFKKDNLIPYSREDLQKQERGDGFKIYLSCDFAVSEREGSDRTAIIPGGVDHLGRLWILPDIFWKVSGPAETVTALLNMVERRKPVVTIAERGHISKSLGPYIEQQKRERGIFGHIEEITPTRAKDVRARSFQGLTEVGKVLVPTFASWWEKALHEMLTFPGGKNDDFVDACSLLGGYVHNMIKGSLVKIDSRYQEEQNVQVFTLSSLKRADKLAKMKNQPRYEGR
jgi:predicted phage terminase large subunit-like protein